MLMTCHRDCGSSGKFLQNAGESNIKSIWFLWSPLFLSNYLFLHRFRLLWTAELPGKVFCSKPGTVSASSEPALAVLADGSLVGLLCICSFSCGALLLAEERSCWSFFCPSAKASPGGPGGILGKLDVGCVGREHLGWGDCWWYTGCL